jgi:integrase
MNDKKQMKTCLKDTRPKKWDELPRGPMSDNDLEIVFKAVQNELHRMVFWVCLNYGLRPSEACNLRLKDVMLKNDIPVLRINKQMAMKWRYIPITQNHVPVWENWFEAREKYNVDHDWVFFTTKRHKLKSLNEIFENVSKVSGVIVYSHRLRYTYALKLWRNGIDILMISQMLGHGSFDTTLRYLAIESRMRGS